MRLQSRNEKKVDFVRSMFGGRRIPIIDPFELSTLFRKAEDGEDWGVLVEKSRRYLMSDSAHQVLKKTKNVLSTCIQGLSAPLEDNIPSRVGKSEAPGIVDDSSRSCPSSLLFVDFKLN